MTALIKVLEGFDLWPASPSGGSWVDVVGKGWIYNSGSINVGSGRFGGQAIGYNGGYQYYYWFNPPQNAQKQIAMGAAYLYDSWSSWYTPGNALMFFQGTITGPSTSDVTVTSQCGLKSVNGASWRWEYSDTAGNLTPIYGFTTPANNTWTYMEACLILDEIGSTTGTFIVRQDGVDLCSISVSNTVPQIDFVQFGSAGSGGSLNLIDDAYIYNGQGLEPMFLGPLYVATIHPTADVSNTGSWTPSTAGSLTAMVNGSNISTLTGTITSTTTAKCMFDVGSITGTAGQVVGVQVNYYASGSGGSTLTGIAGSSSGTSTSTGTITVPVGTYNLYGAGAIELDPATNERWTFTGVQAAPFGISRL